MSDGKSIEDIIRTIKEETEKQASPQAGATGGQRAQPTAEPVGWETYERPQSYPGYQESYAWAPQQQPDFGRQPAAKSTPGNAWMLPVIIVLAIITAFVAYYGYRSFWSLLAGSLYVMAVIGWSQSSHGSSRESDEDADYSWVLASVLLILLVLLVSIFGLPT